MREELRGYGRVELESGVEPGAGESHSFLKIYFTVSLQMSARGGGVTSYERVLVESRGECQIPGAGVLGSCEPLT